MSLLVVLTLTIWLRLQLAFLLSYLHTVTLTDLLIVPFSHFDKCRK